MTKRTTYTLLLITTLFIVRSNAQAEAKEMLNWANNGKVSTQNYNSEIPFRYIDGYIFLNVVQKGKTYNFLFDTGAEATVIDKSVIDQFKYVPYSTSTVSGPLISNQAVSTLTLSSIYISDVEFVDIGAVSIDMKFAKKKFCKKVDGIIGSTLLKKTIWQIDYENNVIRLSDKTSNLLSSKPAYTLNLHLPTWGWGTETIELNIDGYVSKFNFDTGNGRDKIVLNPSELKNFSIDNNKLLIEYGYGKSDLSYKLIAKNLTVGDLNLKSQSISFQKDVGNLQLLGNRFFENFLVTIDWKKHQVYLDPKKEIRPDAPIGFELDFRPNFETNKIEVATGLKTFIKKNKIKKGAILLKVNETDISNLSHQEFCDFWNEEWPKLTNVEKLNLVVSQKGKSKEIIVTKKKLI